MLPKSTIVLAVATCIPFGLAIRDTAAGKYEARFDDELERFGRDDDDDDEDEDYRSVAARRAMEEAENRLAVAEYEQRQESERVARNIRIKGLYSPEVAMLGTMFESIHFGDPAGKVEVESTDDVQLMLFDDGVVTHSLSVHPYHRIDGDCDVLETGLREAWGEPRSRHDRWIWVNPTASQRAVWSSDECRLTFERIASVESWLDKSPASVIPLWAIGKPAKQLLAALGDRNDGVVEDQITWSVIGFGTGRNPAQIVADVKNGNVVSLFVSLDIDGETQGVLGERITKLVGKEPEIPADRPDMEVWKGPPRITLEEGAPQTFLTIGKRPE